MHPIVFDSEFWSDPLKDTAFSNPLAGLKEKEAEKVEEGLEQMYHRLFVRICAPCFQLKITRYITCKEKVISLCCMSF